MVQHDKYPTISSFPYLTWKLRENLKATIATNSDNQFSDSTRHLAQKMHLDFVEHCYGDGSTVFQDDYVLGRQTWYISLHKIVIVAAFLDPSFKNLHPFVPETDRPKVFSCVLSILQAWAKPSSTNPESVGKDTRTAEENQDHEFHNPLTLPTNGEDHNHMFLVEDSDSLFAELVNPVKRLQTEGMIQPCSVTQNWTVTRVSGPSTIEMIHWSGGPKILCSFLSLSSSL